MEDYEKITEYIGSLYKRKEYLLQKSNVKDMEIKKYISTVDDCTANFLRLLIKLAKPMNILEIGTSVGYSTTSMALEVKEYGGKITTIEFDEKVASFDLINAEKFRIIWILFILQLNLQLYLLQYGNENKQYNEAVPSGWSDEYIMAGESGT
jgi:predicted O-methyltransferase YrrM